MPPSSAWMRASTIIIRPPTTHEIIAAGPAAISPFCAPNSQPEPMIEPTEAHIRPISPISRLRANECLDGTGDASATDMFVNLQRYRRPGRTGQTHKTLKPSRAEREHIALD